jgi:DNA polymerase III epsilon subunit-like protein
MIAAYDFESTGINTLEAEIIEGYFIAFDESFVIKSEFHLKCNPKTWSEAASRIHGISKETAATYPPFEHVYQDVLAWLRDNDIKELWCHTKVDSFGKVVYFDYALLRMNMFNMSNEAYFEICKIKPFSTHSLAKVLAPQYNFQGFSLDLICKDLGIKLDHHQARSDAFACYEIIKQLLPKTNRDAVYNHERKIYDSETEEATRRPKRSKKRVNTHSSNDSQR